VDGARGEVFCQSATAIITIAREGCVLKILVVGGYDRAADRNADDVQAFGRELGPQIIRQGHALLSACQTDFDADVAGAAYDALKGRPENEIERRLISFVLSGTTPSHSYGRVLRSRLVSWDTEYADFIPEPVQMADAVIMVRGFDGAKRAAWWSRLAKKPLLPVATFDGAAKEIFDREIEEFDQRYASTVDKLDYQGLDSGTRDWPKLAASVVALAENLATPNRALVIMSYTQTEPIATELANAFASFKGACEAYKYRCDRVTETNTKDSSIVAEIVKKITDSAFVIADLTELKQNVFFELGFARGLGKRVIATAKEGTELPFDVKDIPVTFWQPINPLGLREKLIERIKPIAEEQGHI
jgi:hypothetical protein